MPAIPPQNSPIPARALADILLWDIAEAELFSELEEFFEDADDEIELESDEDDISFLCDIAEEELLFPVSRRMEEALTKSLRSEMSVVPTS